MSKIIIALGIAVPLIFKSFYIDKILSNFIDDFFFGGIQVILNDAIIGVLLYGLFLLSLAKWLPRTAAFLLRLIAISFYVLYLIDLSVLINFNSHLVVSDIIKYASYSLTYIQQQYGTYGSILLSSLTAVLLFFLIVKPKPIKFGIGDFKRLVILLILSCGLYFLKNDNYTHAWAYQNVVKYNIVISSESKQYSTEFIANFSPLNEVEKCTAQVSEKPNIIILMIESLSNYQSKHFSGIYNWMPNLDRIARENISYTNFFANGFSTEDGEISLLTGRLPIYPPASYSDGGGVSFNSFYASKDSLPETLNSQGYYTEFLTTADLNFSNTKSWLTSLKFDYIEGAEGSFYQNLPRYHFNAASDEMLYERLWKRIKATQESPYFIFSKTVTTHHPYKNPDKNIYSEESAFRYSDKQIGAFYDRLKDNGFFDDGLLVIVGDHHSMIPLREQEVEKYGEQRGPSRVPLIIAYKNKRKHRQENFQQVDVYNTLKQLPLSKRCSNAWQGDIFSDESTAKYIGFRRGDKRNIVSVFNKNRNYSILLNGDQTHVEQTTDMAEGEVSNANLILNKINSIRIAGQLNQRPVAIKE